MSQGSGGTRPTALPRRGRGPSSGPRAAGRAERPDPSGAPGAPGVPGGPASPASPGTGPARRPVPAAGALLRRERLHRLLDSALDGPWALLSAPAGCGKSSLLARWAADLPAAVPVCAITDGDLAGQLREAARWAADGGRRVLLVDHPDSLTRTSWRRLAELAGGDRPTTVVVATRVDPPLPLGRLAIAGQLVEIRAKDLRWTEPEMRALLRHTGLDLDEKAIDLLRARTAGWSAGLRLAVAGMTRAEDPYEFLTRFGQDDHATIDYLGQEVFAALPQRLRDLLSATAGTSDLTAASAAALSGLPDAGLLLDNLVDEGLLCTADDTGVRCYRYHPLLLSLLRRGSSAPGRVARQRAARWHASHARPAAAIVDASYAGDHELTAGLLQEHGPDLLGDAAGRRALAQGLSSFPPDWRDTCPRLLPLSGLLHWVDGDLERATQVLTVAEHRLDDGWPAATRYDLVALRAWAAVRGWRDPARCLSDVAEQGCLRLDPPGLVADTDLARDSLLLGRLGILHAWHGDPGTAALLLEAAGRCGRSAHRPAAGMGALLREAQACQALLLTVHGQPRTAVALAQEVLAAADESALADGSTATARLALAWSGYLRGLPGEARTQLARAEAGLTGFDPPGSVLLAAVLRARLVLPLEGPAGARAALQVGRAGRLGAPAWARALAATTELRVATMTGEYESALAAATGDLPAGGAEVVTLGAMHALHAGEPAAARAQVRPVLAGEVPAVIQWTPLRASYVEAAAADALGDPAGAAQGVVRTLVLGAAEELVLPLGETPAGLPGVLDLLDAYPRAAGVAGAPGYLAALRDRLPGLASPAPLTPSADPAAVVRSPPRPPADVDPAVLAGVRTLTDRELEVLGRLDSVLPLSTIAHGMYVTVNTLKTHVGAIYRKLGVDSRADAVQRAQQLGLISRR
jgi:LuxR family transcriptional regulator, maltose regulon positive regulatory protein